MSDDDKKIRSLKMANLNGLLYSSRPVTTSSPVTYASYTASSSTFRRLSRAPHKASPAKMLSSHTSRSYSPPRTPRVRSLRCFCSGAGACPNDQFNDTCYARDGGYCFAAAEEVYNEATQTYEPEWTFGCLPADESGLMQCKGYLSNHHVPKSIACCKNANFCNQGLKPNYTATIDVEESPGFKITSPFCLIPLSVFVLLFFALVIHWYRKSVQKCGKKVNKRVNEILEDGDSTSSSKFLEESLPKWIKPTEMSGTSGSGYGVPLLREKTLADELKFIERIDNGRYGKVWKCLRIDQPVAVKVYRTLDEQVWAHEAQIHSKLTHQNISVFIGSDILPHQSAICLVMNYYANGSLNDYLKYNFLDEWEMLSLMDSLACGLIYLHSEIIGNPGKPSIAHLNLKSRNIMVSDGGKCLISDFAHANCYSNGKITKEAPLSSMINPESFRYCAPEILNSLHIRPTTYESAEKADTYSFSLILWEIASRCILPGTNEPVGGLVYRLPYEDDVPYEKPSLPRMREIVCSKQKRPKISNKWSTSTTLTSIAKLLMDLWHHLPSARLPILRLKKDLDKIKETIKDSKISSVNEILLSFENKINKI